MNFFINKLKFLLIVASFLIVNISSLSAQTLEIVFVSSLWGSAIGGVSGVAVWALQDEDEEDKLFPKYTIKGMALGLFAGMGVGIFEAKSDDSMFMSNGKPKGFLHLDSNSLAIRPAKLIPRPLKYSSNNSSQWSLDLITANF